MNTKILVTGTSGFVGANLTSYFKSESQYEIIPLNVRESIFSYISKASAIVHLAGKAHDLKNVSHPQEYYEVNFELTKKLYDIFLDSEAKNFIFISTVKAVADHLDIDEVLREDYQPNPQTHYGKSKLMAEEYIQSRHLPCGKTYYILRPCMIHGPGNKGNLNLLYKLISKGIPYPLAAFENKRSFLSVENLCFVIRELLDRNDVPSGVYNLSDNEPFSTNELINLIAQSLHQKALLWKVSPGLIKSIAKLGDFLKLPLSTERLNKLTENYIVDNTKIAKALGKNFPLEARDGLIKTIRSFKVQ